MQASIGNREKGAGNQLNRRLRPGFALALSLPMVVPAACLANGAQGFVTGGMPFAGVSPVHAASFHVNSAPSLSNFGATHSGVASSNVSHSHNNSQLNPLVYQLFNPSTLSFAQTSALAKTQVVHNLVTYVLPSKQLAALNSSSSSAFDLDLGSKADTVVAAQIPGFGSGTVNIKVGGQNLAVNPSTQLTQAEAAAVYQVLSTGKQSLTINASGAASGGSLTIAPAYSQSVDGLSIPKGVSVIDESADNATLLLSNGLMNNGNLYLLSANGSTLPVSIAAPTIHNSKGALISLTLPSSLTALNGYGSGSSLALTATTLTNGGSIYAPNNLTLTATNIQNDGSITAKSGNLAVQNNGGNLTIGGAGSFNAGRTVTFDVASTSGNANANLTFNGNSIYSKTVNFNDSDGALNVNADSITGGVNATAATVAINTVSNLNLLTVNASGDPTVESMGNLVLSSATINTHNEQFTALAGGNITTSDTAKDTIDTSQSLGPGYDITIGAGVTYIVDGNGTATITGKSLTGGSIVLPNISLNTNSADITLVANQGSLAKTGTISILNVTASGNGSSMFHDGGNITITADGNITTSKVTSTGLAGTGGDGGVVTIISNKGSVTTSDISVNGGSGVAGGKSTAGMGGDGGDGGDGYDGGALGAGGTIGGEGGSGGSAGSNAGGAGGAGAATISGVAGTGSPPATPTGKSTILGGTGGNGGQALTGSQTGYDGKAGLDGEDGTDANGDGKGGGDAGRVIITAHTSISTGKITAVGGAGGGGGAGGDGGNGGNGGGGGYGGQGAAASGSAGLAGGNGGDGGSGGGGGDGSDGGDGGNGGTVTLNAGTSITSKGIDVTGGAGGSGGKGGKGGDGGYGGDGAYGGTGGTGSPDSLGWLAGYYTNGALGDAIYVANWEATSNSGAGGAGGSGGNGGSAGDGGDGGSGGKGGKGGDAGSININAGTTVSVTSIARAGGAGGNGGTAGQGGQYGQGGDGGGGGSGGYTSFTVGPPVGSPPSGASMFNGLPVLNPNDPEAGLPFNPGGYVQGPGGAGGAGGDGGSGANNQGARSGDGGSGGDGAIGGLSGNLTIVSAKAPSIGSQIFFNGPSGKAGLGASYGMPAPLTVTIPNAPPAAPFSQTGKAGTGGNGTATAPFIPLAPSPNPGSTAKAADGKAGMVGVDGDSGADGSTPTPRGGSGLTSLDYAGVANTFFPHTSVSPAPEPPPFVAPWSNGIVWQGAQSHSVALVHINATERNAVKSELQSSVVEIANTSTNANPVGNSTSIAALTLTSTASGITINQAALTQSNAITPLVSNQTIAGVTNMNAESFSPLALATSTLPPFQLGAGVQTETQVLGESCQLYRPGQSQILDFGHAKVSLQKNAVALIARKGDAISVYNLGNGKKGEISLDIDGYKHNLGVGQQIVVSSTGANDFAAVNIQPDIAWRLPRLQILPGGKRVFAADFSIVSALQKLQRGKVAGLQALDPSLTAKMLKSAAILASLTGADYVQTAEAAIAK